MVLLLILFDWFIKNYYQFVDIHTNLPITVLALDLDINQREPQEYSFVILMKLCTMIELIAKSNILKY